MTSDLKEQLAEEKARHLEAEEGATSIIEELREALSRSNLRLQAAEEGRLAAEATTAEERVLGDSPSCRCGSGCLPASRGDAL
eukprot:scaffold1166_cov261-Pinguiococcus_pyrenoidosus.AAC.43